MVAELVCKVASQYCDNYATDKMGNCVFKISPEIYTAQTKRIMFSAHMDEVGLMITEIDSDGYLRFDTLGGIDCRVLCGRNVIVGDESRRTNGVIASKAIHHQTSEERKKVTKISDMYIDIGATSKEDAEKYVDIGDFVTFDSDFILFGKDKRIVKSKALDDRMGCAVMLEVMKDLSTGKIKNTNELYFCFTVREEVGLSGAQTVAQVIKPDYAIVLESTAIADIEGVEPALRVAEVGKGGVVSVMDRSTVYNYKLVSYLLELAELKGVKAQVKRYVSGGNDAGHIHKSGNGVKTAAISIPTRYLHSPACVASLDDLDSVIELVKVLIETWKSV
jgi:endoglucanase